jgi:DNA helicase-2/ATP-dependent DNA helicase PcrA
VEQTEGPVMIIAGAGSGKTRVIVYRIAHLIRSGAEPFSILALTFTNKAAREMRERIASLSGPEAKNLWMGTFHSVFARILRQEADKLHYPRNFTIYDTEDSKSLIRTLVKEMNLDDKQYTAGYVLHRISQAKNNLISVEEYEKSEKYRSEDSSMGKGKLSDLYRAYSDRCFRSGAMDFDDLLYKTNVLFRDFPESLYKYQNKFRYIMVDEYQDTNFSQYLIVKKLALLHENICVVGDDAQSIYAFRGATIQNILNFERDYPDVKVFKLEENYRSTQNIVGVANSLIAKNSNQLQKTVFSNKEKGAKIKVLRTYSDNEEGKRVSESILEDKANQSLQYKDFGILYRTNAQSRSLEEALRRQNIPYKIFGGLSFYQRKEIKDLIAYFRLTINPHDEEALKRVINYPARGIGKTTLDKLILLAGENELSLWGVLSNIRHYLSGKTADNLDHFAIMIKSFAVVESDHTAFDLAMHIAKQTGLLKDLYDDKSIEGLSRYENIQALLNGLKEFSDSPDREDKSMAAFLEDVALLTGDEKEEEKGTNTVSLMTIHASKGLEFSNVYVVGMEENLFPSQLSLNNRSELEEERRLFYVALTRAQKKLTLSYATSRYKWGSTTSCEPSRFLEEMDASLLELDFQMPPTSSERNFDRDKMGWDNGFSRPVGSLIPTLKKPIPTAPTRPPSPDFKPSDPQFIKEGMEIEHERFGTGSVISIQGPIHDLKATIEFKELGTKQLLLKFAKLRIIEE